MTVAWKCLSRDYFADLAPGTLVSRLSEPFGASQLGSESCVKTQKTGKEVARVSAAVENVGDDDVFKAGLNLSPPRLPDEKRGSWRKPLTKFDTSPKSDPFNL